MTDKQKIFTQIAAGFVTLLMAFESGAAVKQIQRPGVFQLVTSGDGTRAWRINTLSGEILYCSPGEDSKLPVCEPVETPPRPRGGETSNRY